MVDRYVYDVTRRLPKAQRADIEQELRGLIEDMLEQAGPTPRKEDVEAVLTELGRPSELASKYRGKKRFLIGPELFDTYLLVIKIVMGAVALGITIATVVGVIASPPPHFWIALADYLSTLVSAVVQAFAYVTIVFAIIERFAKRKENWKQDAWKPVDLPEIPKAKARIKPSEPIAGIVFAVIALMVFNTVPHLIGIYQFSDGVTITPVFDLDVLRSMIVLIDILFVLAIVKEAFRLVNGKHSIMLATAVTIINAAMITITIAVFLPPAIWNGDMIAMLQAGSDMTWAERVDLQYIWSIVPKIIVGLSVFGYVVEIITSWVRGARNAITG